MMSMTNKCFGLVSGLFLCILSFSTAYAIPITWSLSNVTFDDGGIADGSFIFDADTNMFSSINVQTSGGTLGISNTYLFDTIFADANFPDFVDTSPIIPGTTSNISLALVADMTNAGGIIAIQGPGSAGLTQEAICDDTDCNNLTAFRQIVSGSITSQPQSVPEPSILALMSFGLIGLIGIAKRKKA
jgi:hypothetical protein